MATSLAAAAARRLASHYRDPTLRLSADAARFPQRRGFASAGDHHGPTKVNCWQEPMNPGNWKEEHFVIASLSGWGLLIVGGYKFFSGGKEKKEEKLVEAKH